MENSSHFGGTTVGHSWANATEPEMNSNKTTFIVSKSGSKWKSQKSPQAILFILFFKAAHMLCILLYFRLSITISIQLKQDWVFNQSLLQCWQSAKLRNLIDAQLRFPPTERFLTKILSKFMRNNKIKSQKQTFYISRRQAKEEAPILTYFKCSEHFLGGPFTNYVTQ